MATILVVDDEPDIRYLAQINLEMDGHRVMTAGDGQEALESIEQQAPDVMVLDVMMPNVDGWQVLETVKAHLDEDIKNIPILMLTARGGAEDRARGGIEGAVRYLTKPITPEALRQAVTAALTGDPEPVQRKKAQVEALADLARLEGGGAGAAPDTPRPKVTRLERVVVTPEPDREQGGFHEKVDSLTVKQRALLETIRDAASVSAAAADLEVSRSNVYASLRRINRKLGTASVPELLDLVRRGSVVGPPPT